MYSRYILVLFSFFVFSSTAYAEHEGTDKETIKALVQKVKKAAPSQRRLLMNELKIQLRTMHQETRMRVMLDLRRSFNGMQHVQQSHGVMASRMHHQDTMSMTESKHMQEHMMQSGMAQQRPTGEMGGGNRAGDANTPQQMTPPKNRPTSQTVSPQRPEKNTPHTPMRGM